MHVFNFVQKIVINTSKDVTSCQFLLIPYKACVSPRPLHLASRCGLKRAVQELLSQGASVQEMDDKGMFDLFQFLLLTLNLSDVADNQSGSRERRGIKRKHKITLRFLASLLEAKAILCQVI